MVHNGYSSLSFRFLCQSLYTLSETVILSPSCSIFKMFCPSSARCLSILLALSAISRATPQRGAHGGHGHTHTVTPVSSATSVITNTQVQNTQTQGTQTLNSLAVSSPTAQTGTAASTQTGTGTSGPSSTPSSVTTNANGKRGIAYNSSSPDLGIFDAYPNVGWGVDWDSKRAQLPSNFMFVPQLWSDAPDHTGSWVADIKAANPQYVLGSTNPTSAARPTCQSAKPFLPISSG